MKLSTRTSPEELATLLAALKASPHVESVESTSLSKADLSHKTGSALIFIKFKSMVSADTVEVTKWERRSRKKGDTPSKRDTKGYVYLLRTDTANVYKIGKSTNIKSRRKTFGVKLPFAVEYEHVIKTDDMHLLEKTLHKKFAPKRLRGSEFFALTAEDVQWIISLGSEVKASEIAAIQ
jgi:hypothetical protein